MPVSVTTSPTRISDDQFVQVSDGTSVVDLQIQDGHVHLIRSPTQPASDALGAVYPLDGVGRHIKILTNEICWVRAAVNGTATIVLI